MVHLSDSFETPSCPRYQIDRLRLWCEQQLAALVGAETVCDVLCQAHLYDAKQLEEECLSFVRENIKAVCVAPSFGALGAEWPAVLVKVNHYLAGVEATEAAPAIEAATTTARKAKRRRDDDDDDDGGGGAEEAAEGGGGQ